MSRVEVTQESAPLSDGMLQTVLPLSATSQFVKDNVGNTSALSLSTSLVGIGTTSPLGLLHLKTTAATTRMVIDGDSGQNRIITYRTNGVQRFGLYVNNTAESGSNVGSDFAIRAYNDAGTLLNTPFFIKRNTGHIGINTTSPTARIQVAQQFGSANMSQLDRFGLFIQYNSQPFGIAVGGCSSTQSGCVQGTNQTGSGTNTLALNPIGGNVCIGEIASTSAKLQIKGDGATSATTSLLVQNSAGTELLKTTDAGLTNIRTLSFFDGNASMSGVSPGTILCNINPQTATPSGFIVRTNANLIGNSSANAFAVDVNNTKLFSVTQTSQVLIGSGTVNASAVLQIDSTTKGFLPPRMTTAEKNLIATPAAGLIVYDTTLNKLCVRTVATWETITSV